MTDNVEFVDRNDRGVGVVLPDVGDQLGQPPHVSHLYRHDAQIPRALGYALRSYRDGGDGHTFTALSVGCSFGPEVDTILSEVNEQAPELGSVVVRGYDPNRELIEYARNGVYRARVFGLEETELLREFDLVPIDPPPANKLYGTHYASSAQLRAGHDVDFVEADFGSFAHGSPDDPVPEADLIVCCRVLEHLPLDSVELILRAIDRHLRPGGVLDIGVALGNNTQKHNAIVAAVGSLGYEPLLYSDFFVGTFPFILRKPRPAQPSVVSE